MSRIEQALLRALDTEQIDVRTPEARATRPDPRLRLVSPAQVREAGRPALSRVEGPVTENPYTRRALTGVSKPRLSAPDVEFARTVRPKPDSTSVAPVVDSGVGSGSHSVVESGFSRTNADRRFAADAAWDVVLEQARALVRPPASAEEPKVARVLKQAAALARVDMGRLKPAPTTESASAVGSGFLTAEASAKAVSRTNAPAVTQPVVESGSSRTTTEQGFTWVPVQSHTQAGGAVLANPIAAEQFRKLAGQVIRAQETHGVKVITVTSAIQGEGKSVTSSALALTLANSYKRDVLLVDADMRLPSLQGLFQLPAGWGLAELLDKGRTDQVSPHQVSPMLAVLTAGRPTNDPVGALTSARMRALIEAASAKYDFVILDTPPVAVLPDANLLGSMVDAALLVIKAGETQYEFVTQAVEAIRKERILGVVLNHAEHGAALEAYQYSKY